MKQDRWTQQLHDKLADYEVAVPETVWAGVEAGVEAAVQRKKAKRKARVVAMRRWVVAASLIVCVFGTAMLWNRLTEKDAHIMVAAINKQSMMAEEDSEPVMMAEDDGEPAMVAAGDSRPIKIVTGDRNLSEDANEQSFAKADESIENLDTQPTHDNVLAETSATESPEDKSNVTFTPPSLPLHSPFTPHNTPLKGMTLGLYAMNALGTQDNSNGVIMAEAMAKSYEGVYNSSLSASRMREPIYLSGFEERQHHYLPISFGLTMNIPVTGRLSANTGVVYTRLRSDFTQTMRDLKVEQVQTLHYVGIPLGVSYRLWDYRGLRLYASAFAQADWNVGTKLKTEGVTQHLDRDRMQWSVGGGLGLQYNITPQIGLYAEPAVRHYIDNDSKIRNYFKDKPTNFSVQVGLRFDFFDR